MLPWNNKEQQIAMDEGQKRGQINEIAIVFTIYYWKCKHTIVIVLST